MKQIVDKLNKIAKKIDGSVEIPQTDLIIDSLDAITKAYGGTPNDSHLIVDKLEDIYNNIGGGGGGGLSVYTCTLHCHNGLDEPFDFADVIISESHGFSAYAIDPETNYLMPAINISAVVESGESLDIVTFIQVVEGGLLACVLEGAAYSSTMLYDAINCSLVYDSENDEVAIACEQGKNAEITFDVGGVN